MINITKTKFMDVKKEDWNTTDYMKYIGMTNERLKHVSIKF